MSMEQPRVHLDPLTTVAEMERNRSLGQANALEIGHIHQELVKIRDELHATRLENRKSRVYETLVILSFAAMIAYAVATTATENTIRVLVERGLVRPAAEDQKP